MANPEHVELLKQGVAVWNAWREETSDTKPELNGTNLNGADLSGINLSRATLNGADLSGINLSDANLDRADLSDADMRGAILTRANLSRAGLIRVNLTGALMNGAILSGAFLGRVDLSKASLMGVCLKGAMLTGVNLNGATLSGIDLSDANLSTTTFAGVDLSAIKGLETVQHSGPSNISIDTLFLSRGKIPEVFLRGCGVPEIMITYLPALLTKPIQFYSCFISYSHTDKDFARRLHDRLQGEGIRCWRDEHDLNPGDPLHRTVYEAIRLYDKLVLCCSETALKSWWVEKEFTRGINKEQEYCQPLIIPVDLDGYLFNGDCTGWVADEIKQRSVQDCTGWKDHDRFEVAVKRVMKALRTDGGHPPPPKPKLHKAEQ